jgi:hypothetical protein
MFYEYDGVRSLERYNIKTDIHGRLKKYLKNLPGTDEFIEIDRKYGINKIPGYKKIDYYPPEFVYFFDWKYKRNSIDVFEKQ